MIEVHCESKLRIINPPQSVIDWCRANLRLPNPDYYKREAMGKWLGGTPEYFDLYERVGNMILIPFGCSRELNESFSPEMHFKASYSPLRRFDYKSSINLYPYQEAAVKAAESLKNGIMVMPCGAGKTQTALELVARIGGRCLWLTHTQDLLNQSMYRAKACFGCDASTYGTITGGRVNIGTGITFATVQTMSKINLSQYRDAFDIVIVDECHKAVGTPTRVMQFYRVLSALSCRYKYGITATPKRADGLEKSMYALLGGVVYEVSRQDVAETTCPVNVEVIHTGFIPDIDMVLAGDGTLNYAALVDNLTHDKFRFDVVFNRILDLCSVGRVLVLANRVEYIKQLADELERYGKKAICLSTIGSSKSAKAMRKNALRMLNNGEVDCVLATYQLAKEGLDVPNLRYVVFATPEKDETTVMQAAGRVGRKAEGKEFGTVIDFVDNFGMLKGWAKKRRGIYKKLDYTVTKTIDI